MRNGPESLTQLLMTLMVQQVAQHPGVGLIQLEDLRTQLKETQDR